MLQTIAFILFMLSMYCTASMLPCGRYYYEPEGGYVGNPWVKFSYQYAYLYLGWIIHHLDTIEHFIYRHTQNFINYILEYRKSSRKRINHLSITYIKSIRMKFRTILRFSAEYRAVYPYTESK